MEKKLSFSEVLKKYTMVIVLVLVVIMFTANMMTTRTRTSTMVYFFNISEKLIFFSIFFTLLFLILRSWT